MLIVALGYCIIKHRAHWRGKGQAIVEEELGQRFMLDDYQLYRLGVSSRKKSKGVVPKYRND